MKVSYSCESYPCSSCKKRARAAPRPDSDIPDAHPLRFIFGAHDSSEILDLKNGTIVNPGREDYVYIERRASAAEMLFRLVDERDQLKKIRQVDAVVSHSKRLMEIYRSLLPKPAPSVLNDLYEFDPVNPKFLARRPRKLTRRGSAIRVV